MTSHSTSDLPLPTADQLVEIIIRAAGAADPDGHQRCTHSRERYADPPWRPDVMPTTPHRARLWGAIAVTACHTRRLAGRLCTHATRQQDLHQNGPALLWPTPGRPAHRPPHPHRRMTAKPFDRDEWLALPLTRGDQVTLIDAADLPLVAGYSWYVHTNGYVSTEVRREGRRRRLYMHRVILGPPAGVEVDHRNRDPLDNRRANLRPATSSQQNGNQRRRSNNASGYRGVSRSKHDYWQASIRINGRSKNLGAVFPTAEAAALAYDAAAVATFGEFATLNFPGERSA